MSDFNHVVAGSYDVVASDVEITSKVDRGETLVSISSNGSLETDYTGNMDLSASGTLIASGGLASLQLSTDSTGQSSVMIDGGADGSVTLANALPIGTAQTVKMDATTSSIEITNGNVPGTMQSIKMCGETKSIEISAGGLPESPTISMSPTGIKLSFGPTNSIEIGPEGVSINGIGVDIKAEAQTNVGGPLVNVQADGIATVKGAIVQIQ